MRTCSRDASTREFAQGGVASRAGSRRGSRKKFWRVETSIPDLISWLYPALEYLRRCVCTFTCLRATNPSTTPAIAHGIEFSGVQQTRANDIIPRTNEATARPE